MQVFSTDLGGRYAEWRGSGSRPQNRLQIHGKTRKSKEARRTTPAWVSFIFDFSLIFLRFSVPTVFPP